jgi:hypothetical protein
VRNTEGPSKGLLLWTRYIILVVSAIIALALIWQGHVTGESGGNVVLWQVVRFLAG